MAVTDSEIEALPDAPTEGQAGHSSIAHRVIHAFLKLFVDLAEWTPTVTATTTDPDLGTDALRQGWRLKIGRYCFWWFHIKLGAGSTPGEGFWIVTAPDAADTRWETAGASSTVSGLAVLNDSSAGLGINGHALGAWSIDTDTAAGGMLCALDKGTGVTVGYVTHESPWAWDDGDQLWGLGFHRTT